MNVGLCAIEYYLPDTVLTNEALAAAYPDWTAQKILEKTGIGSRHIAADDEYVSDLAEKAARLLFDRHRIAAADMDFLILVTENPDYVLPPTSSILQSRLGLPQTAGAVDVNLGCSGFIYGLKLAKALVASGEAHNVLLLCADAYSKRIHPMDRSTRTIFGDGAAAAWVADAPFASEIGDFAIGTDGSGYAHFIIPAGGLKSPCSEQTGTVQTDEMGYMRSQDNIYMNGQEIFSFALRVVPKTVNRLLADAGLELADIDWFVFHQANKHMLEYLQKKLKIPAEKYVIDMEDIGNTVSASIPIALKRVADAGRLQKTQRILLCGFGVGLSWGGTIVQYGGEL